MYALERKAIGALAGAAVGDALGGATEGWTRQQIFERHSGPVTGIVGPFLPDWRTARPASPYHKGDGHVTDDTLMTNLLVKVYQTKRDHLDAYDAAELLVPLMNGSVVWIPELERETVPLIRLFLAEKWLVSRLHYGHADPREAGVGNMVNCGAAMYSAPIGIANAGNPRAAYAEAIDLTGAHQSSYGREAAGVFAAAVAAAFRPGATVDTVIEAALDLAHDGTHAAIEAVCARAAELAGDGVDAVDAAVELRKTMAPFDTVGETYRDPGLGARRPSRLHSIEELPLAFAMLLIGRGRFRESVLGGVNYGRDSDSIATMSGAISGALHGIEGLPADWVRDVGTASRLDLQAGGLAMADVAREIFQRDQDRAAAAGAAFAEVADRR